MTILLIADYDGSRLSDHTAKALSAALQIGGAIDVLVAGHQVSGVADQAAKLDGAAKVLIADDAGLAGSRPEALAHLVVSIASAYTTIVAPATSECKAFMPRVAAMLDVMQISEVVEILAPDKFKRPIYAGNAIQVVKTNDRVKVLTVRTAAFQPVSLGSSAAIEPLNSTLGEALSTVVGRNNTAGDGPELASAKVVIAGGRALGSEAGFEDAILPVARRLGAAVGASRAAVDAGYAPNDWQIGQTGKTVSPDLYIAVGISGAIQHLAGFKDSKIVVAINNDPDAPIFQHADYGLVADLFSAMKELAEALDDCGFSTF